MGAFVDDDLLKARFSSQRGSLYHDAFCFVIALPVVWLSVGHASETEADLPSPAINFCRADFLKAHARRD